MCEYGLWDLDVLQMLSEVDQLMEIAIGLELSPEIAEKIPKIIQLVSEMIM